MGSPPGLGGAGGDPPRRSQPCPLLSFGPEPHGGAPTCRDRRVCSRRLKARSPQSASQQQWVRRQPLRRPRPFPSACSGALCLRSAPHVPPGLGQLPLSTTLLDVLLLPDRSQLPHPCLPRRGSQKRNAKTEQRGQRAHPGEARGPGCTALLLPLCPSRPGAPHRPLLPLRHLQRLHLLHGAVPHPLAGPRPGGFCGWNHRDVLQAGPAQAWAQEPQG